MSLTRHSLGMRQSDRRRRFHSGHVPAGRHSHYGECRSEPRARCAACQPVATISALQRRALVAPQQFDHRERSWSPAGASTTRRRFGVGCRRRVAGRRGDPCRRASPRWRRVRRAHDVRRFLAGRGRIDAFLGLRGRLPWSQRPSSPAAVRFSTQTLDPRPRRDARQACSAWL